MKKILFLMVMGIGLPFVTLGPNGGPLLDWRDLAKGGLGFDLPSVEMPELPSIPDVGKVDVGKVTQIYKWLDENGQWVYGTDKPEGIAAEVMNVINDTNLVRAVKLPPVVVEDHSNRQRVHVVGDDPKLMKIKPTSAYDPDQVRQMFERAQGVQGLNDNRADVIDAAVDGK